MVALGSRCRAATVSRILVIGGYGGFGAAISEALATEGHEVLVAGRSLIRAEAFCAGRAGLIPFQLDRAAIFNALVEQRPCIVVDASGPFQAMDYTVPRACIAAKVAYSDIADSSDFVCGIAALDAEARAAGVPVISGASSVPALSGAVIRMLAAGMSEVSAVELAISASNRASAGPAVAAAILGQVGQPMALGCNDGTRVAYGWQEPQRLSFAVPEAAPLAGRKVYLVNVPDICLVPARLPGKPMVTFRAGTELGFQNWMLWLLSWPVRWRWTASLAPLARWLAPLQRLTARLGSERSAMMVRIFGLTGDQRIERRWALIAESGDGLRIPALTVPPLIDRILAGEIAPGARDAGEVLDLAAYQPGFSRLYSTGRNSVSCLRKLPRRLTSVTTPRLPILSSPAGRTSPMSRKAGAPSTSRNSPSRMKLSWSSKALSIVIGRLPSSSKPSSRSARSTRSGPRCSSFSTIGRICLRAKASRSSSIVRRSPYLIREDCPG